MVKQQLRLSRININYCPAAIQQHFIGAHMNHRQKHISFMWLYLFVIYLPFCAFLLHRHPVHNTSMSVIGWGSGLHYLALYLALTLPFGLYLLFTLNRLYAGNRRWITVTALISSVFMVIGGFIPLEYGAHTVNRIHEIISIASSIIFMFVTWVTLILCARESKHKVLYLTLCSIYPILLIIGFSIWFTAALYQILATISFLLVLAIVNTVVIAQDKSKIV